MSVTIEFEELIEQLCVPEDTLILFHRKPDADAVGSAFALKNVLESLGSRAWCVCCDEVPDGLRFLMDEEQESVLPAFIPDGFSPERIISVDTASPAQLGSLFELYGEQIDLSIDHHRGGEAYASHAYIRPDAAATGEILFDVVKVLATDEKISISDSLCIALYAGISGDTGGFRYSNVTPKTHLRVAELLASGIDHARVNRLLFDNKSMEQLRAQSAGISNLRLFDEGRVAVITFPYALKVALGLEDEDLSSLVDTARSVAGVQVAICITQPAAEGKFRASVRSSCDFDVCALCQRFGGGGHIRAAGCTLTAEDIHEAMKKILDAIDFSLLHE